jgi:hypothetical protein
MLSYVSAPMKRRSFRALLVPSVLLAALVDGCGSLASVQHDGPASLPQVSLGDAGSVLANPRLVAITFEGDPQSSRDQAFARAITQTDWLEQVGAEYGVTGASWGGSVTIGAGSIVNGGLDEAGATAVVEEAIDAGAPSPNGQTVYMVFPPSGVFYLDQPADQNRSWNFATQGSPNLGDHILVTYTGEPGENNNTSPFDFMTAAASQGLIDILTHGWMLPAPSPLWSGSFTFPWFPGHVGILAHDSRTTAGGFVFQRVWSNAQAKLGGDPLLPAADEPYFNIVASPNWVTTAASQTEQVSFTGWATGSATNWTVETWVFEATGGFAPLLSVRPARTPFSTGRPA